jgi:hypothetical protein
MDYLKQKGEELKKLIQRVRSFGEDIYMEFEVDKCKKISRKKKNHFTHIIYINSEAQVLE